MTTDDIQLYTDSSWTVIPLTSTQTNIFNISGSDVFVRLGASSSSNGICMKPNSAMIFDETVYVRPSLSYSGTIPIIKISVTR